MLGSVKGCKDTEKAKSGKMMRNLTERDWIKVQILTSGKGKNGLQGE